MYRHIADELREQMRSGDLAEGELLPSEAALMQQYETSQGTVRKAVALLRAEGWLVTEPGKGVAVRRHRALVRLANDRFARWRREAGRAAFQAEVSDQGLTPTSQVVVDAPANAPADVAELLRLKPDEQVAVRRRRMLADGEPVQLATSYIPWSIAQGTQIAQEDSGPGGIYARIEEAGYELAEFQEEVCARAALPDEVETLQLPAGVPVILVTRVAFASGDRPVEVCQHVMAADRHMLFYRFPAT
jgi:GntR family transcriptional regulator